MEKQKRKGERTRSANFTENEERLLIHCVKKYLDIIECKKTDSNSNFEKLEAWKTLAVDFNKANDRHRTYEALKVKYVNLKKNAKKAFATEKTYNLGTNGGPYNKTDIKDVDIEMMKMLKARVTGLNSQPDCDSEDLLVVMADEGSSCSISNDEYTEPLSPDHEDSFYEEVVSPTGSDHRKIGIVRNFKIESTSISKAEWSPVMETETSPEVEQMPALITARANNENEDNNEQSSSGYGSKFSISTNISQKAREKPANPLKSKLEQWASAKSDLVELQKKCLIEEHQKKMSFMEEKHKMELRHMEEEHKAKMSVLLPRKKN